MDGKPIISWILVISTFLIAGKALKLIDIPWAIAFGPVTLLIISFFIIFVLSFIYMYKTIPKKTDEDGKKD
jgi:membrane protein implicated in regulation of membrane protease activity